MNASIKLRAGLPSAKLRATPTRNRCLVGLSNYGRQRAQHPRQRRLCGRRQAGHDLVGTLGDGAFEASERLIARVCEHGFAARFGVL